MSDAEKLKPAVWDGKERRRSRTNLANDGDMLIKTLRATREALTSRSGLSNDLDWEILAVQARNFRAAALVLPCLALFMGLFGLAWLHYFGVLIWLVAVLCSQVLTLIQSNKFMKLKLEETTDISKWHSTFISLNFLNGLVWATYIVIPVTTASLSQPVFTFTTLLVVVAVCSVVTSPVLMGMISATTPISMILFLKFSTSGYISMIMMAGLFVGAQLVFILVSMQVRGSLIKMLEIKSEKDTLILDLEEATAASHESRRRAEEANLAKSRFLATMSHELRTPLNAILGFSQIMKEGLLGPIENDSYREYVGDIYSSGDHLLNLINEILDLSRIEAGRYELNEEAVELIDIVEDCRSLISIRAKGKDISIKVTSEAEMPRLWADERAIRQVVLNLLSNAIKFTPQGGEISVSVGWTSGGGQYVSIKDTGSGVSEEEIPTVLSQFGQGTNALKSAEQGTGLGLPISQALVNMHSGTFDFKSKLRVGTTVTISFPRERVMTALAPIPKNQSEVTTHETEGLLKSG